jgi:hypothetical protein
MGHKHQGLLVHYGLKGEFYEGFFLARHPSAGAIPGANLQ